VGRIGNRKVGVRPKFTLAVVTRPVDVGWIALLSRRKKAFVDVKTHFQQAYRQPHAPGFQLRLRLRSINDQYQALFGVVKLFGAETLNDAHRPVAFRTFLNNGLV
jgi:hypothetical protein